MKKSLFDKLKASPINYFSDLFMAAVVVMWIADNVYQSIVATIVTISSVIISAQTGIASYDTTMWTSIGTNTALPLSCGGAVWLIKCAVQHTISNYRGEQALKDFPAVHPEGETEEIELETEWGKEEDND